LQLIESKKFNYRAAIAVWPEQCKHIEWESFRRRAHASGSKVDDRHSVLKPISPMAVEWIGNGFSNEKKIQTYDLLADAPFFCAPVLAREALSEHQFKAAYLFNFLMEATDRAKLKMSCKLLSLARAVGGNGKAAEN
jgi:hypothetical protein